MPPRSPKVLGFSPSDFNRVARMLKDYEQGFPQLLSRRTPYTPGQNHQWVKLDSTTPSSGRYDGKWYERDESTPGWTAKDDVWVVFANGATPSTSKYYLGVQTGYQDSRPVFCVFDQSGGSVSIGTGGESKSVLVKVPYTAFTAAATSQTITVVADMGDKSIYPERSFIRVPTAFNGASANNYANWNFYDGTNSYGPPSTQYVGVGYTDYAPWVPTPIYATDFGQTVSLRVSMSSSANLNLLTQGELWIAIYYYVIAES